jgi:hypothetical protein
LATSARTPRSIREKRPARSPAAKANGKANGNKVLATAPSATLPASNKPEAKVLFQKLFHSVGPRTYAAQVKELGNGNHLLVLTEGKRDLDTGEVRKTRLLIFGEDFSAFFKLLSETAGFIRANPLSDEIRQKRSKFWAKKSRESRAGSRPSGQ